MRTRTILIALSIVLLIAVFVYWRGAGKAHPKKPAVKIVKVSEKKIVAPPVPAAPAARRKTGKAANPKVVIVMDDFGYNMNNIDGLFAIGEKVTLSILPNQPYSEAVAEEACVRGYEVILHLPMEPHSDAVAEEQNTIGSSMSDEEIKSRLEEDISAVPGVRGVSNHMGSMATEDRRVMRVIFRYLKSRGLFFLDSLTSENSVCREVAAETGLKFARRDIFLDNSGDPGDIAAELEKLGQLAFRRGSAIAVCHDRPNTVGALAKAMPRMAREGVRFVTLSEMVK